MLNTKKKLTITGESVVDGKIVCVYSASIDLEEPGKTSIGQFQKDKDAYKANSAECRADYAAFEDFVWATEKELIDRQH